MPELGEKDWNLVRSVRKELQEREDEEAVGDNRVGLSSFAIVTTSVKDSYYEAFGPCYANIDNTKYSEKAIAIVATPNYLYMKQRYKWNYINKHAVRNFLDWLINDSPWNNAIISKDLDEVVEHGIVCRTDIASNYLAGALIAYRQFWEYPSSIQVFSDLLDVGLDGFLAFIAGHWIFPKREDGTWFTGEFPLDSHTAISPSGVNKEVFHNYTNRKFPRARKIYTECPKYYSYDSCGVDHICWPLDRHGNTGPIPSLVSASDIFGDKWPSKNKKGWGGISYVYESVPKEKAILLAKQIFEEFYL